MPKTKKISMLSPLNESTKKHLKDTEVKSLRQSNEVCQARIKENNARLAALNK